MRLIYKKIQNKRNILGFIYFVKGRILSDGRMEKDTKSFLHIRNSGNNSNDNMLGGGCLL